MKTTHTLFLLFLSYFGFSQTLSLDSGTTRAVVIGISDYQNEDIPDLRFADKDAQAFATYLKSSAGGNLPDKNIKLLLNEQATNAAMIGELDWLMEESEEGDQAIIYFSGHGDVESKMARQPGFLLTYDSPSKVYMLGAYPLFYLQLIIETLSTDKNVKTIVITDACRAGKLAGSEIGGIQATASNLAKQYANEIKILSCQPDEFSLEGEQWGGGRGAFSYHLIEGLIGLADKNENLQVNLLELENYLETKVPEETAPQSQIPLTVGSKGTAISFVDADVLKELKSLKERELPTLAAIESRGIEQTLLASVDTIIQQKYDAFIASLNDENLLDSEDGKPSADELYRELIQEESLADLHRFMTRQYATALQNDAQQVINAYLQSTPTELEKRWQGDTTYGRYPRYLGRAAELLGKQHYVYNYLIAKQLYFEGLNLRLQGDQANAGRTFYQQAMEKLQEAIQLEDRAAYFYNELGVLNTRMVRSTQAKENFEKAIELAPEWGLPYVNYCVESFYLGDNEQAIEYGEKALELLPAYPQLLNLLGWIYADRKEDGDRSNWLRKGVELKDDFVYRPNNLLTWASKINYYKKSIELLKEAVSIDSNYVAGYLNLGVCYTQTNELNAAIIHLNKALELDSTNHWIYGRLGDAHRVARNFEEGEQAYEKAISLLDSTDYQTSNWLLNFGILYRKWGKKDLALKHLLRAAKYSNIYAESNIAALYNDLGDFQKAEWHKIQAIRSSQTNFLNNLGRHYEKMNRPDDAEWMYLKSLEILPDFPYARENLIKLYLKTRAFDKALEWQQKAVKLKSNDTETYFALARTYYMANNAEKAKEYFDKAIQLYPNRVDAHDYVSWYYWMHGEYEEANEYIKRAYALEDLDNNQLSSTYWHHSWVLFDNQKLKKSLSVLKEASEKYPHEKRFYEMQFYFNYWSGKFKESIAAANKHKIHLSEADALIQLAELTKKEDFENAITLLEKLHQKSQWDINIKYSLVRLNTLLGHYEKACNWLRGLPNNHFSYHFINSDSILFPLHSMQAYHKSLRRPFPEKYYDDQNFKFEKPEAIYFFENCIELAKYYEQEGEQDRALFLYEKAVELKPDTLTSEAAMNLAEAYLKLNRYQEAVEICPDSIHSEDHFENFSYATLYYKLNRPEKAEAHFQRFTQLRTNPYRFQRVAVHYYLNSEPALMEKYVSKTEEIYPTNPGPYIGRGLMNASLGKYDAAMRAMEEGIKKLPDDNGLKIVKAFIIATYHPSETSQAFKEIEPLYPDAAKIGECMDLMRENKFEEAKTALAKINETNPEPIIPALLDKEYVRMLVAEKDFKTAMDIIEQNNFVLFPYHVLQNDSALAPLRETEQFKAYMQRNYPGKINE
jgi:tetratricopeptide (TPR) repeat protein